MAQQSRMPAALPEDSSELLAIPRWVGGSQPPVTQLQGLNACARGWGGGGGERKTNLFKNLQQSSPVSAPCRKN